tara:strand:+ start:274 stop:1200 length:927 start_codon:yes stop_codon:yes gene_type:complete
MKLLIINYHYFRNTKSGKGIHPITTSEFVNQLDLLSKKYLFISQKKLLSYFYKNSFPKDHFCLITFDDGLKEQLKAFEIMKEKKIPAIFFVSTMPLITNKVCMVHKFHYVMEQVNYDSLLDCILQMFPDSPARFKDQLFQNMAMNKYIYDEPKWAKIKFYFNSILNQREKHLLIDQLFQELEKDEERFSRHLYMNDDDIKSIAQSDMLGSHCETHEPLGSMSDSEIHNELLNSKKFLSTLSSREIHSVSYPFGDAKSVTQGVIDIANEIYSLGITTERGINCQNDIHKRSLSLKRVSTSDINDGEYLN